MRALFEATQEPILERRRRSEASSNDGDMRAGTQGRRGFLRSPSANKPCRVRDGVFIALYDRPAVLGGMANRRERRVALADFPRSHWIAHRSSARYSCTPRQKRHIITTKSGENLAWPSSTVQALGRDGGERQGEAVRLPACVADRGQRRSGPTVREQAQPTPKALSANPAHSNRDPSHQSWGSGGLGPRG
jgi:hypothetical protein